MAECRDCIRPNRHGRVPIWGDPDLPVRKNQRVDQPAQIHAAAKPLAVLDIDGVLADVRHRLHHVEARPKNWAAFFTSATTDPLLPEGAAIAATLERDHEVVYLTGRPESCRRDTVAWLSRHGLPDGIVLMRATDDRRPARQTKLAVLRQLSRRGQVAMVVDDDPTVIEAVTKAGFPALLADWIPRAPALADAQEKDGRA
jgi:phosphoglycolate phosphatase-like HAD superfamily hydrolase